MLTSLALPAKESPQMGSFILTYLDALFLVSKIFNLVTKISLKNKMRRGEDSPDSTEPHLSTDMDSCLVFGREPVKFLSLSLVCGGALCVFIPSMAKCTQLGDGCSLGKYEGEEKYGGLSQKPACSGNWLFPRWKKGLGIYCSSVREKSFLVS